MQPRRKLGRTTSDGGYTLVEAMVALVIFGVGAIALLQLAPRATQFSNRGHLVSEATNMAQAKVEELRALPSQDASLSSGTHVDPGNPIEHGFDRRWIVTSDTPMTGMNKVEVRVRFKTLSPDSVAVVTTYF
jgi:prepilin-type N-terminal cleavage/methylation domain-containing protein